MYATDEYSGCCVLSVNEVFEEEYFEYNMPNISEDNNNQISKLNFDGALEKDELGAGGLLTPPSGENVFLTCKLEFETTNNVVEYEVLILGLQTAETLKIAKLVGFGDLELVINQIKGIYQNRHIMIFIESWYGISDLVII